MIVARWSWYLRNWHYYVYFCSETIYMKMQSYRQAVIVLNVADDLGECKQGAD